MILLTVITEETLSVKSIGRWYDDDSEESTYITKHLFCLNPQNETMYFGIQRSDPIYKIKKLLSPQNMDYIIGGYGWETHEYSHEKRVSYHRRQYIDKETTYEICQILNDGLGFTLYCPCVFVNPATTNTVDQTWGGRFTRIFYPHYLPSPTCCVTGIDSKVMSRVNWNDFIHIPYSIKKIAECTFKPIETKWLSDDYEDDGDFFVPSLL